MKYRTLLFFLLAWSMTIHAAEPVNPSVKHVTVFRSGCQIVRTAQVSMSAGVQELVFTGFGSGFDQASVQIKPNSSVRIASISFESNFLNPLEKKPDYKALRAEQKVIMLKYHQEQITREALAAELDLILSNKLVGGSESGLNPDLLTRTADVFRIRVPEIKGKIIQSDLALEVINEQKSKIEEQIAEMEGNNPQQENLEIHVVVETSLAGSQQFELSYFHPLAGWVTAYDLRVKSLSSPVEVINRAQVWQTTGEDWKDMTLRVSTGSPRRQMRPSELVLWPLDFISLYEGENMYKTDAKMEAVRASNARVAAPTAAFGGSQAAQVRENLTFLEYQLPGFSNLASTQKLSTFELENYSVPAEYKYHVVPKRDQYAFLQAYISNWQDYNLSQGEMSIFFEGTFVGKNYFDPRQVQDTLALSLGPDIAVQVKRERIKEKCKTATLFGKSSKDVAFTIKIRNNKPNAIDLTIIDQVPVSVQSSIEIEVDKISGGELNKENGLITWKENIPSGQSISKEVAYTVKYPKGKQIGATD